MKKFFLITLLTLASAQTFAASEVVLTDSKVVDVQLTTENVRQLDLGRCSHFMPDTHRIAILISIKGLQGWTDLNHPGLYSDESGLAAISCIHNDEPSDLITSQPPKLVDGKFANLTVGDIIDAKVTRLKIDRTISNVQAVERNQHGEVKCASYQTEEIKTTIDNVKGTNVVFVDTKSGEKVYSPIADCH